jgi:hypothetical protein
MDYPKRRLTPYPNRKQRIDKVVDWKKRPNEKYYMTREGSFAKCIIYPCFT